MLLYKKHKTLSKGQTSVIGFVLALMSVIVSVVIAYGLPLVLALLNRGGIYHLDLFLMAIAIVFFFSVQGLLLYGFPLSYAKDKKSHMTGFQILVFEWIWMLVIAIVIIVLSLVLFGSGPVNVGDLVM